MLKKTLLAILIIIPAILASPVTTGDNQAWIQKAFTSRFELGKVYKSQTIQLNFLYKPLAVSTFDLTLYDSTDNVIDTQSCTSNPCTATFDASKILIEGNYYIIATLNPAEAYTVGSVGTWVRAGQLTITGDDASRSSSTLVRFTTSFGAYRFHRIYLPLAVPLYTVVVGFSDTTHKTNYISQTNLVKMIQQTDKSTDFNIGVNNIFVGTPDTSSSKPIVSFNFASLAAGYYWIIFDMKHNSVPAATVITDYTNNWQYILSYSTQPYLCPYDKSYPDHKNIFSGCIQKSAVTDLPCVVFNASSQVCSQCYIGYHLTNGKCLVDDCPVGKYFDYGKCYDIPLGCKAYNQVTDCTDCLDTYKLTVDNQTQRGKCTRIPLVCTGRTFYNVAKYICDTVSADCNNFSTVDGKCTSCNDITKKLVDGTCITAIDNCGIRQYIKSGDCFDVNPLCQTFERVGGKCLSCIFGYKFDDNKNCVLINCPTGFVPNDYGNCIKVSQLCLTYDIRGRCLVCVPSHLPDSNGVCLQSQSPTPCPARQYLGFDSTCHQISQFCDIYNAQQQYCVKCKGNYLLMSASNTCVLPSQCTGKFYRINNDCHQADPNCQTWVDDQRKCSKCNTGYDLYYGICITTYKCGARQWKDGNKKCQDVSTLCGEFDPSTGKCTSCVTSYQLKNGICCPKGQYNLNGICTAASSASQIINIDGCKLYAIGNGCVTCQTGYSAETGQDGLGFCSKNN